MNGTTRRFSTGLTFLDRRIGGGLIPGSLLSLAAPPASQSELLIAELIRTRPTTVVSTTRPEGEVQDWATARADTSDLSVITTDPESILAQPERVTEDIPPESFVVLDSVNGLETDSRERYLELLNHLKGQLRESDSVGILHCIDQVENPAQRGLTLHRSDDVWQLEVLTLSREIKTRLLITKARHGRALTEPVPLRLTDRVQVDTSRHIG